MPRAPYIISMPMISRADPHPRHRRAAFALLLAISLSFPRCSSCPANRKGPDASVASGDASDSDADAAGDGSVDAGPADTFALFCFNYTRAVCAWLVVCNQFFDDSQGDC